MRYRKPCESVLEAIGNTPLAIEWPRGTTRTLIFKLAGHKELSKVLRSEADQSFDFPLEPLAPRNPGGTGVGKKPPPKKDPEMGAFE